MNRVSLRQPCLAVLLAGLLPLTPLFGDPQAAPPAASPQAGTPQAAPPQAPTAAPTAAPLPVVQGLKVLILAGNNEANDLSTKIMAPLVVQVIDQNDRPVEGAEVIFRFPISGPSAIFTGGKTSQTVRTNGGGQAAAMNWFANDQTGRFDVHISASYGNQVGETTLQMINAAKVERVRSVAKKNQSWFAPTWVKIAVIAAGAGIVAGVVLGTRGGKSSTSTTPTITITPGSPTIGGPH